MPAAPWEKPQRWCIERGPGWAHDHPAGAVRALASSSYPIRVAAAIRHGTSWSSGRATRPITAPAHPLITSADADRVTSACQSRSSSPAAASTGVESSSAATRAAAYTTPSVPA